jgi:hypothetical protein
VKRLLQLAQRLRRRMLSPSSLTRESMTCVSGDLQKGHFMQRLAGMDSSPRRLAALGQTETGRGVAHEQRETAGFPP